MEPEAIRRKLAAILLADVVSYSRLMGEDEAGTLTTWTRHRRDFIDPRIAEHDGRIVSTAGDSLLVEFESAVRAVECAIAIQRGMAVRNQTLSDNNKMLLRIGINLGDVIVQDNDLFGDGVNVAARLQQTSEVGGIAISKAVYDQVRKRLEVNIDYAGEKRVKNIADPVAVYQINPATRRGEGHRKKRTASAKRRAAAAVGVAMLISGIAAAGYGLWLSDAGWNLKRAPVRQNAVVTDKPTVAVLPFVNLSDDPEQQYFADGMTDDLITDLSKVSGLFVIARNSVFAYKDRNLDTKQIADELGVRYLVEGSVRRAGGKIRVNAQLIDAATGSHLWAERYDRDSRDIFSLQDDILARVVSALSVQLTAGERAQVTTRPIGNLAAYDHYLRAEQATLGFSAESFEIAYAELERALELESNFADAYASLALVYALDYRLQFLVRPPREARSQAASLAVKALELNDTLAKPYLALANLHLAGGRHQEALLSAQEALRLEPNNSDAHATLAAVLGFAGQHDEALAAIETALRLNPQPPATYNLILGRIQFGLRQYSKAIDNLRLAGAVIADTTLEKFWLAPSYAFLGRMPEAKAEIDAILRLAPDENLSRIRWIYNEYKRNRDIDHWLQGLERAGLPHFANGFSPADKRRLLGPEIRELVFGVTEVGQWPSGRHSYSVRRTADGATTFTTFWGNESGESWIEGDRLCSQFPDMNNGRKTCDDIYHEPERSPESVGDYLAVGPTGVRRFGIQK